MPPGGWASRHTAVPLRGAGRPLGERAGDALDLERLDHVADLDVVHAVERDAALEAALDLLHVVLEAAQRPDPPTPDRHTVTQQPHAAGAWHGTARDHAAGHGSGL